MRICMLAPEFLPAWGGVGNYIVELVRHLPSSWDIHVVTPKREKSCFVDARTDDYNFRDYFGSNVTVHFISKASDTFVYNAAFQIACLRTVPSIVRDTGIDVIHSHTAHMPDLLLEFRRVKAQTLTTVHTTIFGQRRGARQSGSAFEDLEFSEKATLVGYPLLRLAEETYFSFPRHYVTPSNWMRNQLLQLRPELASLVTVVHNAVDTQEFKTRTKEEDLVLFTGRFIAAKGIADLVNAIPSVLSKHPDTRFVFVGPGYSKPYERRLSQLMVPRNSYEFIGFLKDKEAMVNCYQSCSVFVAPSLYEDLPIRILEAMSCGKPVVAANVGAVSEVITNEENGLLIQPRDVTGLASAINTLLDNRGVRRQLGAAARRTVRERFDWDRSAKKIGELYEALST